MVRSKADANMMLAVRWIFRSIFVMMLLTHSTTIHAQERVSQAQHEAVVRTHTDYFALREQGRFQLAYNMMMDRQKENISYQSFSDFWQSTAERFGKLTLLDIRKVTWYRDPQDAPKGLYAAVDYRGEFERQPVFCGYLVWKIEIEHILLQREESNFGSREPISSMSDADKEKYYAAFSCP